MATKLFDKAKTEKKAEFYTQMFDIETEVKHYKQYFNGKTILCNCDDPYESNFFKYFASHFNDFHLKKLICTCYDGSPFSGEQLDLFNIRPEAEENRRKAYKVIITEVDDYNGDGAKDMTDVDYLLKNDHNVLSLLKSNGDFRSEECIELLKESDIVVTNPPFPLFREFIATLVDYNKDFIIIGNTNALTYKEMFKLFKENKIRTGYTNFNVGMYFRVPDDYECKKIVDGKRLARVSNSCWFTSLPVSRHNDLLTLYEKYSPDKYPKYINYDAINVNTFTEIPYDYKGLMGVPVTFLDKYNPDQFEIVALGIVGSIEFTNNRKMEILDKDGNPTGKFTRNAKGTLYRIWDPTKDKKKAAFKDCETGELYASMYARVIIRSK